MPPILGSLLGMALYSITELDLKWTVVALPLLLLTCLFPIVGKPRTQLLFLLTLSIPLVFNYHFTYHPDHIGASDGITLEAIDLPLIILSLVWLHRTRFRQGRALFFPATTLPFLFVLASGLLSLYTTNHLDLTFYGLVDLFRGFLLYLCLANNTVEPHDSRTVVLGLNVSVILLGLVCMTEAMLETNLVMGTYQVAERAEWEPVFRSAGLTVPTLTAGYIASLLPLFLSQLFASRKTGYRLFVIATILIGITGLLLTLTRTSFLSLAIGAAIVLTHLLRKQRVKAVHLVLATVIAVFLFAAYFKNIMTRFDEGADNVVARYALARTAFNAIVENPLVGLGLNTYHQEMHNHLSNRVPHDFEFVVHNKFLLTWAEMGPFALVSLLCLILVSLRKAFIVTRSGENETDVLGAGLFASMVVTIIHMNLESYAGGFMMLMFSAQVALIASVSTRSAEKSLGANSSERGSP